MLVWALLDYVTQVRPLTSVRFSVELHNSPLPLVAVLPITHPICTSSHLTHYIIGTVARNLLDLKPKKRQIARVLSFENLFLIKPLCSHLYTNAMKKNSGEHLNTGYRIGKLEKIEWSWGGSNPWPLECHSSALPAAPQPQLKSLIT